MSEALLQDAQSLFQSGRLAEAARIYHQFLRGSPRHFEALYALGMIYFQSGRFEQAQYLFGEALLVDPFFVEGLCMRGVALLQLKRPGDALVCFDRALALHPDFVEALSNRATALQEMHRLDEAIAGFDAVLALQPGHAISWNNRANTFGLMKRFEEALADYDRALVLQPDFPQAGANRMNALFELKRATRCPPGYMRALFDDFAPHYDDTMLSKLGYRAHSDLRALADRVLPAGRGAWRILDLGSGTGLVGDAFKDLAQGGRLDGIDIAPRMIEAARARGIYDDLILDDLENALAGLTTRYDLVLAADTMIYLGDLAPTLGHVSRLLEPGGFYLFAVEKAEGEDWDLAPTRRFRHSENYLRREAARAGLDFIGLVTGTLRQEAGAPVAGYAVALKKPTL
jgi:predicted TPR repeat methyltransferase